MTIEEFLKDYARCAILDELIEIMTPPSDEKECDLLSMLWKVRISNWGWIELVD